MDEAPAAAIAAPPRAALAFILVTVFLDMLAMAMVFPVLPKLVLGFLGGDMTRAAEVFGLFGTVWSLMQLLFSPVLGGLSDRFGRRPVILLSNLGLGLDYVLMALAPTLALLFVGRVISGITAANMATAGAYIADVAPPDRRAAGFGLLSVAFGAGFVLGPAVGGLLGAGDPRLPFWVAGGLSLLNAAYGCFVLPESLPPARRAPFSWRRANPFSALRLLAGRRGLLGLAVVSFLGALASQVFGAVFVLYGDYRYGWDARTVGLTLAGAGLCSAIVGGLLVRPAVARLGERRTLATGMLAGIAGFALCGLAASGRVFWLGIPLLALWGLGGPAVQGLMSRRVGEREQGRLQGANTSLISVAGLFGPGLFTMVFALAVGPLRGAGVPGAPFLLSALLLAASLILALLTTSGRR